MKIEGNGFHQNCPIAVEWPDTKRKIDESHRQIIEVHAMTQIISKNSEHWKHLSAIAEKMEDIHRDLLSAAVGRKQVPLSVVVILVVLFALIPLIDRLAGHNMGIRVNSGGVEISHPGAK